MIKLQKHIWTFIQTDFNHGKSTFNQNTVPAQAELGPTQPQLVWFLFTLKKFSCILLLINLLFLESGYGSPISRSVGQAVRPFIGRVKFYKIFSRYYEIYTIDDNFVISNICFFIRTLFQNLIRWLRMTKLMTDGQCFSRLSKIKELPNGEDTQRYYF